MNKSFVKCNANDFPITLTPQASLALKAEFCISRKSFMSVLSIVRSFSQQTTPLLIDFLFFAGWSARRLGFSVRWVLDYLINLVLLSVCYSFHNSVHLSVRRSFVRFIRVSVGLHVCLFVRPAISLYISSFVCLSVCLSFCRPVCVNLSVCSSAFPSIILIFFSHFCGILFCSIILSILLLTLNLGPC